MPTKLAPKLCMNNGYEIPIIGLGTWKGTSINGEKVDLSKVAKDGEVEQAVKDAIDAGYRHIDTAMLYGTEEEVGRAVRAKIEEGVIKREDIFITTKLWNTYHRPDMVEVACRMSNASLGLGYIDLYLMHFPFAYKDGHVLAPLDADGKIQLGDVDFMDTYRAMEGLVEKKLTRSIGVSNFNAWQMTRVLKNANIKPAVHQIEIHPYLTQEKLVSFCQDNGIIVTAYSPFASPERPGNTDINEERIVDDEILKSIAERHRKTTAQIILRYLIQRNTIPIPKSVTKERIFDNINIFDFELSQSDIEEVNELNRNKRTCPMLEAKCHPEWPF